MAYDEATFRRYGNDTEGAGSSAFDAGGQTGPDYRGRRRDSTGDVLAGLDGSGRRDDADANLADSGRDRLGIHLGWEVVLLVAVGAMAFLLYRHDPASLKSPALDGLLVSGAAVGLLVLGAGLTLRAAVPNLALGPIAVASAVHFAENGDLGVVSAAGQAVAVAVVGALVVGVIVVAFHVPGWAATLAGALGVIVFIQLRPGPIAVQGGYDPTPQALYLFGGFAVLALLGGALGAVPSLRRSLGQARPVGDPALRHGAFVAVPVVASLVVSSVLAVLAGVLLAASAEGPVLPVTGMEWTGVALGTAMVAGTSAFGRRGGVFGTLFAVVLVALFLDYEQRRGLDIALFAIAAAALGAGLVVTRLVETYGRPLPARSDDDWETTTGPAAAWNPDTPEPWTQAVPTAQDRPDRWDDDRWGRPAR